MHQQNVLLSFLEFNQFILGFNKFEPSSPQMCFWGPKNEKNSRWMPKILSSPVGKSRVADSKPALSHQIRCWLETPSHTHAILHPEKTNTDMIPPDSTQVPRREVCVCDDWDIIVRFQGLTILRQ